jgi:hypothetical protein
MEKLLAGLSSTGYHRGIRKIGHIVEKAQEKEYSYEDGTKDRQEAHL